MGTRYFHSRFRIWSIRRRGKVHFIHISRKTTKKAFPKNHTNPGNQELRRKAIYGAEGGTAWCNPSAKRCL